MTPYDSLSTLSRHSPDKHTRSAPCDLTLKSRATLNVVQNAFGPRLTPLISVISVTPLGGCGADWGSTPSLDSQEGSALVGLSGGQCA
eukprot:8577083-Pyramimonas_sp.AAC.1